MVELISISDRADLPLTKGTKLYARSYYVRNVACGLFQLCVLRSTRIVVCKAN